MLRTLAIALLVLAPVACSDDGGDQDVADGSTTTVAEDEETTTTTEVDLSTGTTLSTAGEGTTTTAPPTTQPPPPQPPTTRPATTTTAAGPQVTTLTASASDCDGSGQITLTWATSGAASVEVSIDNENGTFSSGLPANGSAQFPGACNGDTQIYFVKAIAANGTSSTRSVTATS